MAMEALQRIEEVGVVPIIRAPSPDHALRICEALIAAEMPILEVTFTVPGAAQVIRELRLKHPELLVGAGTVLDAPTARAAIAEGAQFLVSVTAPPDVMALGHDAGIPVIPGAYTPTEIIAALALGAQVVKLFPAELGGPAYLRTLRGPLPSLRAFPTGGVSPENIREWFAAGAVAVGVGSVLTRDVADSGDYEGLGQRARALIEVVRDARARRR
jgi:2-dehydro-3-deoxyphosphogluconate aldolase/(4S)-4-hydroxy-2-oxoglutarate aldolase